MINKIKNKIKNKGYNRINQYNEGPERFHSLHDHPVDTICAVIKGKMKFEMNDETIICENGDTLEIPKNTKHSAVTGEEGCTYLVGKKK